MLGRQAQIPRQARDDSLEWRLLKAILEKFGDLNCWSTVVSMGVCEYV